MLLIIVLFTLNRVAEGVRSTTLLLGLLTTFIFASVWLALADFVLSTIWLAPDMDPDLTRLPDLEEVSSAVGGVDEGGRDVAKEI